MQTTVTLATAAVPGQSAAVALNWIGGKPFTANVTATLTSSLTTGDFTLQYTLQNVTSSAPTWLNLTGADFGISSAVTSSAGYQAIHFTSSTSFPDGVTWASQFPIAGIRISSTANTATTLSLSVLQGEGW